MKMTGKKLGLPVIFDLAPANSGLHFLPMSVTYGGILIRLAPLFPPQPTRSCILWLPL